MKSNFKEATAKYILTKKAFWEFVKPSYPTKVNISKITHVN